jgi:F1F0 ATPase subunit 2
MTMNEALILVLALLAGGGHGVMFFGGLWWTLRQGVSSKRPALWFCGSAALRMSITLAGLYLVARAHWERLLACLLGFLLARLVVTRLVRAAAAPSCPPQDASHAP